MLSKINDKTEYFVFHKGQENAVIPDFMSSVTAYFASTPANTAVPFCNQINVTYFEDANLTTPSTGGSLLPASTSNTWDSS